MHGTRLYEAERNRRLADWKYLSKLIKKWRESQPSTYANWHTSIAYGKKP